LVVGAFAADLPADRVPSGEALKEPRLVELCFQTAGVWEIGTTGAMALPMRVGRLVPSDGREPAGGARAVVTPGEDGSFRAAVVDEAGTVLLQLEGYRTIGLPGALDDRVVAPLHDAMSAGS
jgi:hypothetical protein